MKKTTKHQQNNSADLVRYKISSRDSKHYFYGILLLTLVTIVFRPEYAQGLLSIIMGAGGGLGIAQLIRR